MDLNSLRYVKTNRDGDASVLWAFTSDRVLNEALVKCYGEDLSDVQIVQASGDEALRHARGEVCSILEAWFSRGNHFHQAFQVCSYLEPRKP